MNNARLARSEIRELMALLDREVGACGLDTATGRRARALKEKLAAIHSHGNHQ